MTDVVHVRGEMEYEAWRLQTRVLLDAGVKPEEVEWSDPAEPQGLLRSASVVVGAIAKTRSWRVAKEFPALAAQVLSHRDACKWPLLFRLLWRMTLGGEPGVLSKPLDDDVFAARAMARSVKRDVHKMKAFVRFCRVEEGSHGERYVAYHRSEHPIIRIAAPFFARRFGVLRWTILTQYGSATWEDGSLTYGPGVGRERAPGADKLEDFWKTYYASTFNPARANPRAMSKEMPKKYWSTLPEAALIEDLLANAPDRTRRMVGRTIGSETAGAAAFMPAVERERPAIALTVLREASERCQGCEIYKGASCTVFGEGPANARMMLVGEQPGDQEDLAGRPFVGPAGRLLDRALREAGIERERCYVTNAVKHFKWTGEPRGKRRIHSKPSVQEARACRPWLEEELATVKPEVVVLLGSTAAQSLLGAGFRVMKRRGEVLRDTAYAPGVIATIHPSAVLRATDEGSRDDQYRGLVADLRVAAALCGAA